MVQETWILVQCQSNATALYITTNAGENIQCKSKTFFLRRITHPICIRGLVKQFDGIMPEEILKMEKYAIRTMIV